LAEKDSHVIYTINKKKHFHKNCTLLLIDRYRELTLNCRHNYIVTRYMNSGNTEDNYDNIKNSIKTSQDKIEK
jgi:hypothetical protein